MFDKKTTEDKLNSDEEYRKQFMSDPVGTLKDAGLELSGENAQKIRSELADLGGKDLPSGASIAANGVMISISKSF